MSHWVRRTLTAGAISADAAEAVAVARREPGNIATLILPADAAWTDLPAGASAPVIAARDAAPRTSAEAVRAAADAIRSGENTVLMLGGAALRGRALEAAGRIARATGVRLISETSNRRIERGRTRTPVDRLPYPIDLAVAKLKDARRLVLAGARAGGLLRLSGQAQPAGAARLRAGRAGHAGTGSGAGAGMAGR